MADLVNVTMPILAMQIFAKDNLIHPGTNWCGPGNRLDENGNDLPPISEIDKCCKIHDQCPDFLFPGTPYNRDLLYIFNCECDLELFTCFKRNNDRVIGTIYFDGVRSKCFCPDENNPESFKFYKLPNYNKKNGRLEIPSCGQDFSDSVSRNIIFYIFGTFLHFGYYVFIGIYKTISWIF